MPINIEKNDFKLLKRCEKNVKCDIILYIEWKKRSKNKLKYG